MALSWSEGLLAGAAGVAEYSESKRKQEQDRIDRAAQMQEQMRMHQAKSRYAAKMNEYATNRRELKALEGVEVGSYQEQFYLYQSRGHKPAQASMMASRAMGDPKMSKLKRPKAMAEPVLIKESEDQVEEARSPIQNWIRDYFGDDSKDKIEKDLAIVPDTETGESPPGLDPTAGVVEAAADGVDSEALQATADMDFQDPYAREVEPEEPRFDDETVADPDNPGKEITYQVARDKQTGEELWRSEVSRGVPEEGRLKIGRGEASAIVNAAPNIQAIDQFFKDDEGAIDYDGDADNEINRRFPNMVNTLTYDPWGTGDPKVDETAVRPLIRDIAITASGYEKAQLSKASRARIQLTPGDILDIRKSGEAFGILKTLDPIVIVEALRNKDPDKWTLKPEMFNGEPSNHIKPVIDKLKTLRNPSTEDKNIIKRLNEMYMKAGMRTNGMYNPADKLSISY